MSKTTDEALARLEHKLDALLGAFSAIAQMNHIVFRTPQMGNDSHSCPVCKSLVKYAVDLSDNSITRKCECKTGLLAPIDLDKYAPPRAAGGKHEWQGAGAGSSDHDGESVSGAEGEPKGPRRR